MLVRVKDLKRSNARHPAYRQLAEMGLRVFTPMHEVVTLVRGQRVRKNVPFFMTCCLSGNAIPHSVPW